MKALITLAIGLGAIFSWSAPVVAAGLDDIPSDIRQRLYDPKMIDRRSRSGRAPMSTGNRNMAPRGRSATPAPTPEIPGARRS